SFAQQRLWFLEQLNPGSGVFNIPFALKLEGALDVEILRQSFAALLARHEVLRTAIRSDDGEPWQAIAPAVDFPLPVIDLGSLDPDARQAAVQTGLARLFEAPFDLACPPLLRAQVLRLGPRQHVLAVALHHLISDAWSATLAIRELAAGYQALHRGQPPALPELPVQYADFALWQRQYLQGPVLKRQLAYWRQTLGAGQSRPWLLDLPTDKPRPAVQSYRAGSLIRRLPRELSHRLHGFAAGQGLSAFAVVLAGFAVLLHRLSGQDDILIGTPVSNRRQAGTESLLGILLNNVVIRSRLDDGLDFAGFARRINAALLDAQAHQDLPFEQLVDSLALPHSLAHAPLFQVMVAQQLAVESRIRFPGLRFQVLDTPLSHSECDLDLHVACPADASVELELLYALDLFHAGTAQRLLGQFQHWLDDLLAHPDTPIATLALLARDGWRPAQPRTCTLALPEPDCPPAASEPPQGDVEGDLARLWSEVLEIPLTQIGRHSSFFHLGGHSLLATVLLARMRRRFGQAPSLRQLFGQPTVAGLAAQIGPERRRPPLTPPPRPPVLPLSFAQQRLWLLEQIDPGTAAYNITTAIELSGALNVGWLQRALEAVIHRHEILRSRIVETGGEVQLVIDPPAPFDLPVARLDLDDAAWPARLDDAAAAEAGRPFDLAGEPPVRARLLRRAGHDQALLLLTLHHGAADDGSIQVLM
ncbi:MAG: condensation domain-containing protein, partial [Pseudomonadota bacterium]|nr:condensation domain-containing protein [Pseudomonadota bacterium]